MKRRERIFWAVAAFILLFLVLCFLPAQYAYCEINPKTGQEDCNSYNVGFFLYFKVVNSLMGLANVITALSTLAIGIFTYNLVKSTKEQAGLTRESIDLARAEFTATHRPKLILRGAFSFDFDEAIVVLYTIANVGESRAWITQSALAVEVCPPGKSIFLRPNSNNRMDVSYIGPIGPGESKDLNFRADGQVWDAEHSRVYTGGVPFGTHFVGHVVYLDGPESGIKRQLAFRRRYNPDTMRFEHIWLEENEHDYSD